MLPPLVADANIAVAVVRFLRSQGIDVVSAREEGWQFYEDKEILANAHTMNRYVLTHDSDFGKLAVYQKQLIIYVQGSRHLPKSSPTYKIYSKRKWIGPAVDCRLLIRPLTVS